MNTQYLGELTRSLNVLTGRAAGLAAAGGSTEDCKLTGLLKITKIQGAFEKKSWALF